MSHKEAPKVDAPKAEAPKADAPKPAAKAEAPKADAPKPAPKAEAPKADAPKAAVKADAPKPAAKTEAPKAEAHKAEVAKAAPLTEKPHAAPPKKDDHPPAQVFDMMYYVKSALAGGLCCSVTHGAVCPIDVVKTRMQLDPQKYNKGMISAFRSVVQAEGVGVLSTGLGATAAGYFVQGWFKFGGVEFFKVNIAQRLGERKAWENRTGIYLASAAMAEFIADLFLCPLEAVRIRSVSDSTFPKGLGAGMSRMLATDGPLGFYAGLGPILFKQIPYTMAKFAVQGKTAEMIYGSMRTTPDQQSKGTNISISLASGVVAGVVAAIVSHPADTLLSRINKKGAGGSGSTTSRLLAIAREMGFVKLCLTGLGPRCVMIGTLTAGQFGIFDTVMGMVGAKKFHFHDPDKH